MTRTSTEFPPLEPESSASANSAMAAKRDIVRWTRILRNIIILLPSSGIKKRGVPINWRIPTLGDYMSEKKNIKVLTDGSFEKDIQKGVVLVDFHADWCGPCRMLAPVLEEVAKAIQGRASIGKVDIDTEQKIASQFQITSVPTMILFKDGKEVNRLVGLREANAIKEFILAVT